ncbi:hypothetical protein V6N13_118903 [Hibiscus sabdariffa]|uniref:Uncharacterized protein n=1 Tax=Hibiscus sabdariffa TaxID=183260 RepID=A0ABR2DZN2_9ROSI
MSTVLRSIEAYNASRFESRASLLVKPLEEEEEDGCSSSWIGMNSDDDDGAGEVEVESSFNGRSLDTMDSLQQVLPMRRGISSFYNGKSKSFTSLAQASTVEEIAKPENAYTRRRRNLLAINHAWDRKRLKTPIRSSKATLAFLAVAMASIPATTTPCPLLLPP